MNRIRFLLGLSLLVAVLSACHNATQEPDPSYVSSLEEWHQGRIASLMAPDGWLALAGLFWLEPGANLFGADPALPLTFPDKAPDTLGTFLLEGDSVLMTMAPGLFAESDGKKIEQLTISAPDHPMVNYEELSWILIQRNGKYGIRLWDSKHPKIADTLHIDRYPVDPDWRIAAQWVPDNNGQTIRIRNVLDMEMDLETEGRLQFEYAGKSYELTALEGDEDTFFMVFADATSGSETYGGGRYLYVNRPDSNGRTYLDFNKAYNPPCAFTEFATCLLPPAENRLDLAIKAGELNYGDH